MQDMSPETPESFDCKHPVRVNQVVDDAAVEVCVWCKRVLGIYWREDLD
jgi:hypothetical protein